MLELMYAAGLRERTGRVARERGEPAPGRGARDRQGGKDRLVPLGEEAMHWLRRYLDEARPRLDRGALRARALDPPLFLGPAARRR